MKKFLLTLVFLAMVVALAVLGWSNYALRRKVRDLGDEIRQQEGERRKLQQKASAAQRGPKPEERALDRQQIEQQTSELRGLPFKRLRVGDFRVLFEETETEIIVSDIGPRGAIYR